MRTKFYLEGKKITKKVLQERIGEERLNFAKLINLDGSRKAPIFVP